MASGRPPLCAYTARTPSAELLTASLQRRQGSATLETSFRSPTWTVKCERAVFMNTIRLSESSLAVGGAISGVFTSAFLAGGSSASNCWPRRARSIQKHTANDSRMRHPRIQRENSESQDRGRHSQNQDKKSVMQKGIIRASVPIASLPHHCT